MLLANGMTLEVSEYDTHVDITTCEKHGPSTFGAGCNTICIPRENWAEFKELING